MHDNSSLVNQQTPGLSLNETIKPYIKKWLWFVISFFIAIAIAFLYFKRTVSVYNIKSTILIKDAKRSSGDIGMLTDLSGLSSMGTNSIDNEVEVLKSKKLMMDVVMQLGLQTSVFIKDGMKEKELFQETSPIIIQIVNEKDFTPPVAPVLVTIKGDGLILQSDNFKSPIKTKFGKTTNLPFANVIFIKNKNFDPKLNKIEDLNFTYTTKNVAVDNLQKITDIKLVQKEATVIGLSMNYPNREKAKAIINMLVASYNTDAIKDKNSESMKTKDFIDERISIIANELGAVEGQKEQFKVANNITDIAAEASINLNASAASEARLLDIETQLKLTNDLASYLSTQGVGQTLPSNIGLSNQTAGSNIMAYNELILQRNRLLENATTQNPIVVDLTKQIKVLRSSIVDGLAKSRDALVFSKNQVQQERNKVTSKIAKVPAQEKLFRSIERQQQIKESLYLILLQKREETAIALAVTAPKARIVDYAYSSEKPIAPKKMMILLALVFLSAILPFAYIYIKELLNNKIRNKKDIERLSSTSIIGEIPKLGRKDDELVKRNDLSPVAEAFRILMTNMNFMLKKKDKGNIIFVTSTVKGEGKTFVSVNLALTMAIPERKIVLIGSDMRNPQLQRYSPENKNAIGLSEYLSDFTLTAKDVINSSSFNPNCDLIYSGSIPPNPVELLSNGRYQKLVDELKSEYDFIILDTAPLMLVTDTFLIADLADVTIYVVRSKVTENTLVDFASNQIQTNKIKNVGFVLNDVSKENFGYGNKYGYGYFAEEKTFLQKLRDKF